MTTRETLADRLIRQKAILDLLTKANDETRAEAKLLYRPGSADATAAGRVSMAKGRTAARVTDRGALTAWLKAHNIDGAIIVTETINPALVAALCASKGEMIDPATGEVCQVPGIEVTTADPYLTVTTTPEGKEWALGVLGSLAMPAITDGAESGATPDNLAHIIKRGREAKAAVEAAKAEEVES